MGDFERWKALILEYDAKKQAEKQAQSNEAEPKEAEKGEKVEKWTEKSRDSALKTD